MSLPNLELQTNKNVTSVDIDHITIRQSEKGLVLNVTILNADLTAYDLTGMRVQFVDNKEQNKVVIDSEDERMKIVDAKAGKISYTLQKQVYAASGSAWFELIKGSDVLDTTQTFSINVLKEANMYLDNNNYVSDFEALEAHFKALIKSAETTVNTQINDTKKKLQDMLNSATKQVTDNVNSANKQVNDSKNNALNAINEAKNKATQTLTNMQNELNSYTAKYQALENKLNQDIKQINTNATNQLNSLKKAADDQRNSDHATATNQINSDHAAAEKAKNDAVASINSAKDSAIKQAQTDFTNKINSLQSDYNNWKNQRVADFNKQVQDIQNKLNQESKDTTALNTKLDGIKSEMNKLSIDFAKIDFNNFERHDEFYSSIPGKTWNLYRDTATFDTHFQGEWISVGDDITDKSYWNNDVFGNNYDEIGNYRAKWYGGSSILGQKLWFHSGAIVTVSAIFENIDAVDLYTDYRVYTDTGNDIAEVELIRGGYYIPWLTPSLTTVSPSYLTGTGNEGYPKSGFPIIPDITQLGIGNNPIKVFGTFRIKKAGNVVLGFGSNSQTDKRFYISSLMVTETDHMVPWAPNVNDYELSSNRQVLNSEVDLNTIKNNGKYDLTHANPLKNTPTSDTWSLLTVKELKNNWNGTQELFSTNNGDKWVRSWHGGTFTPWKKVTLTDDLKETHENLLHNTDILQGFSVHVHNQSASHQSWIEAIDRSYSNLNIKQFHAASSILGNAGLDSTFSGNLDAGTYTYSIAIRSNGQNLDTGGIRLEIGQKESFILDKSTITGYWQIFTTTLNLKNSYTNPAMMLMPQSMDKKLTGGSIWYAMPKLERGSIVTGWTPNISDINNRIDQAGKVKKVNGIAPDGAGNINVHSQIVRSYDIATKTSTSRKDETIGGSWLVDQAALGGIADAINNLNGNRVYNDATDLNTVTGQGIYILRNHANTNIPSDYGDKRGTLAVYNHDGNAKTQILFTVGDAGREGDAYIRYGEGNNWAGWYKLATSNDLKHPAEKYADYISGNGGTINLNNYLSETKVWKVGNATLTNGPVSGIQWGWIKTIRWDDNTTAQYWIGASGDTYLRRGNIKNMPNSWARIVHSGDISNLQNQINQLKNKETSHVSANETDALNYSKSHPGIPVFVAE